MYCTNNNIIIIILYTYKLNTNYTQHVRAIHISYALLMPTFLVGEWSTGAGGDGGPRGIFVFVLNFGGSMGSFCASTIRMILCLAPEL